MVKRFKYRACCLLFAAVKLIKNVHLNKYGYSIMVLDLTNIHNFFSNCEWGKNDVIFSVDNSLSVHADNIKKDILVFVEGLTNRLDDTTVTAETKYSVNIF